MNKIRISYKLDKHVHYMLKTIMKNTNIKSLSDIIKSFCNEHFSSIGYFQENTALILYSSNLYKYKNQQSYYIFLTKNELDILRDMSKLYGLSKSELISKIFVYIYNINYVSVNNELAILVEEYESKYKNKSMPFFIRINEEQYNVLKNNTDLCDDGPTNLVYILLEEALSLSKKNKPKLLQSFSGYEEPKEKKYIIRANIPIKYYLRFLKSSYNVSETPYSIFNKMIYSKIKEIV